MLATGEEVRPGRWQAEAVRDFALMLGAFQVRTTTVRAPDPVRVTVGRERGSVYTMREYVRWAGNVLRSYAERYSGYPWPAYTLVVMPDVDRAGPNGFNYPTLSFVGGTVFGLIAHETAHQWFYSLVGHNDARDPWLAKGSRPGRRPDLNGRFRRCSGADPARGAGPNRRAHELLGSLRFETIWPGLYAQPVQALTALGEPEAVDCALRAYVVRNAYRTVLPRDLLASLTPFFPDAEEKLRARGARF